MLHPPRLFKRFGSSFKYRVTKRSANPYMKFGTLTAEYLPWQIDHFYIEFQAGKRTHFRKVIKKG